MAGTKTVLRTAHAGAVFRYEDTEVTYTGTEFPSKQAAEDAVKAAARSGTQLYVVEPVEQAESDEALEQQALVASGLVEESNTKTKAPAQTQGGQQGGNG